VWMPVLAAGHPADSETSRADGGGLILIGAVAIGLGLVFATNYRGITETMAYGRTERQVRSSTQLGRATGGIFVFIGVCLTIVGLWIVITGEPP